MANTNITIIQISGTAFSGSTLLDLMLSNDDNAFSCGEMYNLFKPSKKQYYEAECSCTNENCDFWHDVKKKGSETVWESLREYFPETNTFIDSSKNIEWYERIKEMTAQHNYNYRNILIWKTPAEYAYSCLKRGRIGNWKESYINYHLQFFNTFNDPLTVNYSELVSKPAPKLKKICDRINIPYFPGKEEYWTREYHTLFGSNTAKLHLYETDSAKFKGIIADNTKHESMMEANIKRAYQYHRKFFPPDTNIVQKLPASVQKEIQKSDQLKAIQKILRLTEVDSTQKPADIQTFIAAIPCYRPPLHRRVVNRLKKYINMQ